MLEMRFAATLEALQEAEESKWRLGEALLAECGPPSDNGSYARIREAAEELRENGPEYSARHLAQLRDVAHEFPKAKRRLSLPWSVHQVAVYPDILDAIVADAPEGTRITRNYVAAVRDDCVAALREQEARGPE